MSVVKTAIKGRMASRLAKAGGGVTRRMGSGRLGRTIGPIAGGLMLMYGLKRRGAVGSVLSVIGGGMLYERFRDWFEEEGRGPFEDKGGASSFGDAVTVVDRSVSDVFNFCLDAHNLLAVVPQITEGALADAAAPSGEEDFGFAYVEARGNELLAWQNRYEDAEEFGRMEFSPFNYGRATRVELSLWRQPAGGTDLRHEAREALRRLKTMLESRGVMRNDARAVPVEDTRMQPSQAEELTGWAPESGEPREVGTGPSRGEMSSVSDSDEAFAPESGDRSTSEASGGADVPEPERIEENAQEYRVTQGSEESFPASDSPSWMPGRS